MEKLFKVTKQAVRLINLTDSIIQIYDQCTGDIVTIPPEVQVLPERPEEENKDAPFYYVFEKEIAKQLEENGRKMDDIAIIHHKSPGRDNSIISILVWGKDHRTGVLLCRTLFKETAV